MFKTKIGIFNYLIPLYLAIAGYGSLLKYTYHESFPISITKFLILIFSYFNSRDGLQHSMSMIMVFSLVVFFKHINNTLFINLPVIIINFIFCVYININCCLFKKI
jgi:hypothetical protein